MDGEQDNIYTRIRELFGSNTDNLNVMQEPIDIDTQIEYFEHPRDFKETLSDEDILRKKDILYHPDLPVDDRKQVFVELASVDKVEAFKAIEAYVKSNNNDLNDWAKLALQENRMLLESKFLDEDQVFISTGLGGKGTHLRYCVVLITKAGELLNDFRKGVVQSETEYLFNKSGCELESIEFYDSYATIMCVIPLQETLNELFYKLIEECNVYGNFVRVNYIITNVKKLSIDEINELINNKLND